MVSYIFLDFEQLNTNIMINFDILAGRAKVCNCQLITHNLQVLNVQKENFKYQLETYGEENLKNELKQCEILKK